LHAGIVHQALYTPYRKHHHRERDVLYMKDERLSDAFCPFQVCALNEQNRRIALLHSNVLLHV
jgi:hypothetical protein